MGGLKHGKLPVFVPMVQLRGAKILLLSLTIAAVLLTTIPLDVEAYQSCLYCAPDCSHTQSAEFYGNVLCGCPTMSWCKQNVELCNHCVFNGMCVCSDQDNECHSVYQTTFDVFCGCWDGGQAD